MLVPIFSVVVSVMVRWHLIMLTGPYLACSGGLAHLHSVPFCAIYNLALKGPSLIPLLQEPLPLNHCRSHLRNDHWICLRNWSFRWSYSESEENLQPLISTWTKQGSKKIRTHPNNISYCTRKKMNFLCLSSSTARINIAQLLVQLVLHWPYLKLASRVLCQFM